MNNPRYARYHCRDCHHFSHPKARQGLCALRGTLRNASSAICPEGRLRDPNKEVPPIMERIHRKCSCGFETDWPPAWGRHLSAHPDHAGEAKAEDRDCRSCHFETADEGKEPCATCISIGGYTKYQPRGADLEQDTCEVCGQPATQYDVEGVALCDRCMEETVRENMAARTVSDSPAEAEPSAPEPSVVPLSVEEREDVVALIEDLMGGAVKRERRLSLELIDTQLLLLSASLRDTVPAVHDRSVLGNRIERVRELVADIRQ